MTPSVSSSRRRSSHFGQLLGGAVLGRVVGDLVDPAAPDHPDPRPRQDPDRVRVVAAAGAGVGVDLGRPRRGVPGVVRERGDRLAEALVARPAEVDGVVLAGLLGDRHGAGEGGDRVGAVVAWAAVVRPDLGSDVKTSASGCSPRWAATLRSRSLIAVLRARRTPTMATTASRRASASGPPPRPGGAWRRRATSSAAGRRPQ